jgi:4-diphosphocytidyl-2-C-methyl-D-erythritol kinase
LDWLGQFAETRMTGTGSSVFASFSEQVQATAVLAQLPARFSGFVARGVNRSPLCRQLEPENKQLTG